MDRLVVIGQMVWADPNGCKSIAAVLMLGLVGRSAGGSGAPGLHGSERKPSVSRVAVLTGMTRKEASRLMQSDPDEQLRRSQDSPRQPRGARRDYASSADGETVLEDDGSVADENFMFGELLVGDFVEIRGIDDGGAALSDARERDAW